MDTVNAQALACDDLLVDLAAREVWLRGETVHLTRTEFDLLEVLITRPRMALARDQIVALVWSTDWFGEAHMVNVHMSNLRRKIGDRERSEQLISTLHGVGYRFDGDPVPSAGPVPAGTRAPIRTAERIRLVFDANFTLVDIVPHRAVGDWRPEDIIGSYFSPSGKIDEAATRRMVAELAASGVREFWSSSSLLGKYGSATPLEAHTRLLIDGEGKMTGYTTDLFLSEEQELLVAAGAQSEQASRRR